MCVGYFFQAAGVGFSVLELASACGCDPSAICPGFFGFCCFLVFLFLVVVLSFALASAVWVRPVCDLSGVFGVLLSAFLSLCLSVSAEFVHQCCCVCLRCCIVGLSNVSCIVYHTLAYSTGVWSCSCVPQYLESTWLEFKGSRLRFWCCGLALLPFLPFFWAPQPCPFPRWTSEAFLPFHLLRVCHCS